MVESRRVDGAKDTNWESKESFTRFNQQNTIRSEILEAKIQIGKWLR